MYRTLIASAAFAALATGAHAQDHSELLSMSWDEIVAQALRRYAAGTEAALDDAHARIDARRESDGQKRQAIGADQGREMDDLRLGPDVAHKRPGKPGE